MRPISLFSVITLAAGLALAGQPERPGRPEKATKLPTPTGITCTKAGDQLTVSWTAVPGAAQYMIALEAADDDATDYAPAPPYVVPVAEVSEDPAAPITAKVRAMTGSTGKGASKPSRPVACQ